MAIQIWQPGDKIKNDRFHILKQLGTGGFGITYLAEDTIKKQQIVIKTLNANQQSQTDFAQKQENFVKEGFTLKTFNHPHIVKVHEPIQIGDLWGLVMEYIPGQDLADYIIANGRLGEAEALNYIDQIAQALDCVHEQKFFHRDVKPHNIMLRQDRSKAVLIDFGIAKEFVDLETIYLSNSLGTELYKPIEQYEKRGQFGAYTDIYALAVTLYHLLTGAAPGGGSPLYTSKARKDAQDKGWGANLDEHLWGELAQAGVSESTQAAIKAGMEIDPSQRPQTMTLFRDLLWGLGKRNTSAEVEIERGSDCDTNWLEHGISLANLEKYQEAISSYDRALKIDANNINAWYNRGISLAELRKHEEAINSYDRALKIDANNINAWLYRGNSLGRLEKYEEAINSYDRALEIDANYFYAWYNRGNSLGKLEKHEEAINSYDRALKIDDNYFNAWSNRGILLAELGKYKEAINSYDRALEIDANNINDWFNRGYSLGKLEKYEEAINSYDRALKIDTNYFNAWYNRGWSLANLKKYRRAIYSYNRALKIDANCFDTWSNRGYSLAELGKYEKAISSYDRALEIDTNNINAWFHRGWSLAELGKYEEAINSYDRALEIDINSSNAWLYRGISLANLEKYQEAISSYDRALKIDANCFDAWFHRGWSLAELGKYEEAINSYDRALEIDVNSSNAWFHRGWSLAELGRYEEAIGSYDRALELDRQQEDQIRVQIMQAERAYDLNTAAELTYGDLKKLQQKREVKEAERRMARRKQLLDSIKSLKEQEDQICVQIEQAERAYDLNTAAALKYGILEKLQQEREVKEAELATVQIQGSTLLRE
jgi:tetratricopeptide (TPR) repeat protein